MLLPFLLTAFLVARPSEGKICVESSLSQSPKLVVLDIVPMRSSVSEEPLKK